MNQLPMTLENLLDAKIEFVAGSSIKSISEKYKISQKALKSRFLMLDKILSSKLPATSSTKEIITQSIGDRLVAVRENLSSESLKIIEAADAKVLADLEAPRTLIPTKDIAIISDMYSKRLGRLSGVEVDPSAGRDPAQGARVTNIVVNVMDRFRKDVNKKEKVKVIDAEVVEKI